MKNHRLIGLLFFVALMTGVFTGGRVAVSQDRQAAIKTVAENIEKAILHASTLNEQGKIQKGSPLVVPVASDLRLTFTAENFDADLDKAFQLLDRLMTQAKAEKSQAAPARPRPSPSPPVQAAAPPAPPVSSAPVQAPDRLTALRQSEKQTAQAAPTRQEAGIPLEYSVYKNYQNTRQGRMQEEEKSIEAEKQVVIAERQAAAQNQQRKRERDQQLQAQATAWQGELDKQAKASAAAALQWEQEHSFGAYVKRFLGMVVQTSVGAFTGGLLGTISTNLANQAVTQLFPAASTNIYSQAAAAGTSAAITQTGTAVGQSVGQQAGSMVTAPSSGTAPATTSIGTGAGQLQYAPPKF